MRYTGRWRIYYGDGSTFSDRDGSPYDAPGGNVQVICCEYDNGTAPPISASNLYRWETKSWMNCDFMDLPQYFLTHPGPQKIIMGREMEDKADFLKVLERAIKEGVS